MSSIGSFGGTITAVLTPVITTQVMEDATITLADTEQSHVFPPNTKVFSIQARGFGKIKLSSVSGGPFLTIFPGAVYQSPEYTQTLTTIYFQSPVAGLEVELESWS